MAKLGVPWPASTVYLPHGVVLRECPVCGDKIRDEVDKNGENTTNHYGEHCAREHPDT